MFFLIHGAVARSFLHIAIQNHRSVQRDLDAVAFHVNFLVIPFAHRLEEASLGGDDSIHRAVILIRLEVCVYRRRIVQNLKFLACISCIAIERSMDTQSVIRTRRKLKLKAEDEV